jgi:hypothetical protein
MKPADVIKLIKDKEVKYADLASPTRAAKNNT